MNRYSKAARSPHCVYVKMTLEPSMMYFTPIVMHFLYDSNAKCIKFSKDGLASHETVITDYQEKVDIDGMFACNPDVPIAILDGTTYTFFVKSGNKRRHIDIENWNEIILYYQPYQWVIKLFKKYSDEGKLDSDDSE